MAQAKTKPHHRLLHLVMIPLDWLEERSGLVGATKYFLFRKVPRDTNWFHTLGSATLTAFIVQAVTGVVLAFYYKPSPNEAYSSIQYITNDLTLGWLVRGMHRWGASVFIILLFLHMGRVFLFGAYKYPRELNWLLGVMLLALAMLEGFTGYLLPWDQTAYWATVVGINLNATAPFLGPFISDFLRGGQEIGTETLSRFYSIHMLLITGRPHRPDHRSTSTSSSASASPRRPGRRRPRETSAKRSSPPDGDFSSRGPVVTAAPQPT